MTLRFNLNKLSHICSTDTLTANDKGYIDMLVGLEVEENDKDDGATWDSPSQKDYGKEWQQAINKSRASKRSDYLQSK